SAGAVYYACRVEPHWLEIVEREMPLTGLPSGLVGKTLVQISDIHVGPQVSDDYLRHCFAVVDALQPDFLVLTGDFMSSVAGEEVSHVRRTFASVPHGRLATFGILGNHDYSDSWCNVRAADELTDVLKGHGIDMLRNEHRNVDGLTIIGLDDLWSPRW